MKMFRSFTQLSIIPALLLSCLAFAQGNKPTLSEVDPKTYSFLRTKSVTDLVCGSKANYGTGPQCGDPTITWAAASSNACNPIQAQDSRCPPAEYYRGRGPSCPPEIFAVGTGDVCGTDRNEFWSNWGEDCPSVTIINGVAGPVTVKPNTGENEYRVHRSGFSVTVQKRTKCIGKKDRTCRHRDFGVELHQECNLGPKSFQTCTVGYETCRHPNHGEEARAYPSCAHESFGITPKTCTIPDLEMQRQEIDGLANELRAYKLSIDTIRSSDHSVKSTLSNTASIIESTIETLTFREAELTRKIESSNAQDNTENLQSIRTELRESISELSLAAEKIEICSTATSDCDLDSINITMILDTQIKRVQNDLSIIKAFLIKEATQWQKTSESLHSQIMQLINSPQMKDAA